MARVSFYSENEYPLPPFIHLHQLLLYMKVSRRRIN